MTRLIFNDGINVFGLQPEILWALDRCVEVWEFTGKNVTVTSARGGKHSLRSLHYAGHAVDLRHHNLNEVQISQVLQSLVIKLGKNFDVIKEPTHFHIEYQPEGKWEYSTEQPFK